MCKPLGEGPMGQANARIPWIWTHLIGSKCTSGKAFPGTSEQPHPREKSPPQEKTSLLQNQPELCRVRSSDTQETSSCQWTSHKAQGWKGAGPGEQRPALGASPETLCWWPARSQQWASLGSWEGCRGHTAAVGENSLPWMECRRFLAGELHQAGRGEGKAVRWEPDQRSPER